MKFVEIEITFNGNMTKTINVEVPSDFYEWTENGQLKYLYNLHYFIDHNKKTIYNINKLNSIKIIEDV